ncbi:MAG: hypothetical protein ACJ72W_19560 [Actinoallomurus sp.]
MADDGTATGAQAERHHASLETAPPRPHPDTHEGATTADDPATTPAPDPDYGKDLSGLVPHVAVGGIWGTYGPPSFNMDPWGQTQGSGDSNPDVPPVSPISADLSSIRNAEKGLIAETKNLTFDYEWLRDKVFAAKDTVFGQHATVVEATDGAGRPLDKGIGMDKTSQQHSTKNGLPTGTGPSAIQPSAQNFANQINPAMERVLEQIANAIEILGEFTAGVNKAGQSYGYADRHSQFPDPPPSPVH